MPRYEKSITYAVKHKIEKTRLESRSGGIFTALTDSILEENGKVYGCVLNKKFEAIHIGTDNTDGRNRMRGSKYIQSTIGNTYKEVKQDLEKGKKVLFSGTPCQVDGLQSFLGKEYKNLICVDIVCHGVPSPRVWKDYLKWQERLNKGNCINIDFRNKKKYGWNSHLESITIKKNENIKQIDSKVYANLFYTEMIVRPSCYYCPYKSTERISDISIADYWGIDNIDSSFNDNKGVSLVLINSEKGEELFEKIKSEILYKETKIEDSLQPPLIAPFPEPKNRNEFWNEYEHKSFKKIAKKYGQYGIIWDINKFAKRVKRKIAKIIKVK